MPKKGHTGEQIVAVLQQKEAPRIADICRKVGISEEAMGYAEARSCRGSAILADVDRTSAILVGESASSDTRICQGPWFSSRPDIQRRWKERGEREAAIGPQGAPPGCEERGS